jgi:hypothetical protein
LRRPTHLADLIASYNFARRLKSLRGLYENICKIRTSDLDRFMIDPIHTMPRLNTKRLS